MSILLAYLFVRKKPKKFYRRPAKAAQLLQLVAGSDDTEAPLQTIASFDCQIDTFVFHQLTNNQIIVTNRFREITLGNSQRRIDHGGFAPVMFSNAGGNVF